GLALASGDFNGDGFDDLAIGVPTQDVGMAVSAGAVCVLYGSPAGLTDVGNQLWSQDSPGVLDAAEGSDSFGPSLTTGDFDGDGFDDLAIGVEGEDLGAIDAAGAVNVLYGTASGLSDVGNQFWTQDSPGILGAAESAELFGSILASGDFNGD